MQFGRIYVLLVATCCDSHRDVFAPEPSDDSGRRNMSIFLHLFWRVILDPLGLSSRVGAVQLADLGCIPQMLASFNGGQCKLRNANSDCDREMGDRSLAY